MWKVEAMVVEPFSRLGVRFFAQRRWFRRPRYSARRVRELAEEPTAAQEPPQTPNNR
jgi:hypothetical protein